MGYKLSKEQRQKFESLRNTPEAKEQRQKFERQRGLIKAGKNPKKARKEDFRGIVKDLGQRPKGKYASANPLADLFSGNSNEEGRAEVRIGYFKGTANVKY